MKLLALKEFLRSIDQTIFGCLFILLSAGLFTLYSADNNQLNEFTAQLVNILIGFIALIFISKTPPKIIFFMCLLFISLE